MIDDRRLKSAAIVLKIRILVLVFLKNVWLHGLRIVVFQTGSILGGVLDPAVNGGISNYEKAFFTPAYLDEHNTPEEREKIDMLRDLIANQIPLLEAALDVYDQKVLAIFWVSFRFLIIFILSTKSDSLRLIDRTINGSINILIVWTIDWSFDWLIDLVRLLAFARKDRVLTAALKEIYYYLAVDYSNTV